MKNYSQSLSQSVGYSLIASVTVLSLFLATFFMFEPTLGHAVAVDSDTFRIRQDITDETSFTVPPTNVDMAGSITGVTGGTANGSTQFSVISNNASGYYVEIDFEDNLTPNAMVGDTYSGQSIHDYGGDTLTQPDFNFTASTSAQFAYTVNSSTTADTDESFHHDNGNSACNSSDGNANDTDICWMAPSTTAFRIVDRPTAANSGATSTINFRIVVPSGSTPAVTADTYTATATLSLFIQ